MAIDGDLQGRAFVLGDGESKIGRGSEFEVNLDSPFISRPHAMILHRQGTFGIRSLSEKNQTLVSGSPLLQGSANEAATLHDGASIKLGKTTFCFRSITVES